MRVGFQGGPPGSFEMPLGDFHRPPDSSAAGGVRPELWGTGP